MRNAVFSLLIILVFSSLGFSQKDKMTSDELITRHLASIGKPDAIAAAKTRILVGKGVLTSKLGYNGRLTGPAQFVSSDDKMLLAIIFDSNEYPYEKLAFDGKDTSFGRPNGKLTRLSDFVKAQTAIVKQGLFGGALSANWLLANQGSKKAKIDYAGTENINGKQLYKLRVRPSGSGDVTASIYFEPDTFHHVLTVYQYTVEPHMISSDSTVNATAKASYYTLTERFSDFKKVGDLVLPLGYEIDITNQLEDSTEQLSWAMTFSQAYYNEPLEASAFKVS
jgi:hypothetical protein